MRLSTTLYLISNSTYEVRYEHPCIWSVSPISRSGNIKALKFYASGMLEWDIYIYMGNNDKIQKRGCILKLMMFWLQKGGLVGFMSASVCSQMSH